MIIEPSTTSTAASRETDMIPFSRILAWGARDESHGAVADRPLGGWCRKAPGCVERPLWPANRPRDFPDGSKGWGQAVSGVRYEFEHGSRHDRWALADGLHGSTPTSHAEGTPPSPARGKRTFGSGASPPTPDTIRGCGLEEQKDSARESGMKGQEAVRSKHANPQLTSRPGRDVSTILTWSSGAPWLSGYGTSR